MKPDDEFWDSIWNLIEKYDIAVTNSNPASPHPEVAEFGMDVLALLEQLSAKTEWGIRYEARDTSTHINRSADTTQTMTMMNEHHARAGVTNRIPFSARNHRVVSRLVFDWVEES